MSVVKKLSVVEFAKEFMNDEKYKDVFSHPALIYIYDILHERSKDTSLPVVVAVEEICKEFREYKTVTELLEAYPKLLDLVTSKWVAENVLNSDEIESFTPLLDYEVGGYHDEHHKKLDFISKNCSVKQLFELFKKDGVRVKRFVENSLIYEVLKHRTWKYSCGGSYIISTEDALFSDGADYPNGYQEPVEENIPF